MRRVIEPLLGGGPPALRDDDIDYVRNLLLVARRPAHHRQTRLQRGHSESTHQEPPTDAHERRRMVRQRGGRLLVPKLSFAFQEYLRENSENWVERFGHKEAGPQRLLRAFPQRVVNSGGKIERKYLHGSLVETLGKGLCQKPYT